MKDREALNRAALRLSASDPAYLGYWLDRHKVQEQLDDAALAERLGLDVSRLASLALCHTPAGESFANDLAAICEYTALTIEGRNQLMSLLRREQGLAAWTKPTSTPASPSTNWMMAAHDADQPPPGHEKGGEDEPHDGRGN
jgi:hypothetical protein